MKILNKTLAGLAAGLSMMLASLTASAVPVTQLGFALDASGSVATSDYNLLKSGLNAALLGLPTNGSVEISVVSFGSNVSTVVAPTLLTPASLPTIQSAISTHAKLNGTTNTASAILALKNLLIGSSVFSAADTKSIINLATDGFPNSQTEAENAATLAFNAGIDALSIEAIGSGVSSPSALSNLMKIAFPKPVTLLPVNSTNVPNPLGGSFVVPVTDYTVLAEVLASKVVASVTPVPEPATLALLAIGVFGVAASTRRRAS